MLSFYFILMIAQYHCVAARPQGRRTMVPAMWVLGGIHDRGDRCVAEVDKLDNVEKTWPY